ncbi:MAG: hypothetical protein NTX25_13125 [Proteobacteria bacterium]|nr:hypothetical protein [Pseudomonadota bacterium]
MKFKKCLALSCLSFFLANPTVLADELYTPLESWKGEYLPKDYGAFYLKIRLQGFKKNSQADGLSGNIFLHLKELPEGKHFVISQALGSEITGQQPIWKIPVGNYLIQKLSLTDPSGINRIWISPGKPQFAVRYLFLSNLGSLVLSPTPKKTVSIQFQSTANSFVNTFQHDVFAGVIDGYTQKVQLKLGGSEIFAKAEEDFSTADEARSAFTQQRQIAMLYKVDLGREQKHTPKVIGTLSSQDLDFRTCYMDQITFYFKYKDDIGRKSP